MQYVQAVQYQAVTGIVIYNEIIIQLTIMQNQWEPWACFPATRWSHLGGMGDNATRSVSFMSSLLRNLVFVAVIAENPASQRSFRIPLQFTQLIHSPKSSSSPWVGVRGQIR